MASCLYNQCTDDDNDYDVGPSVLDNHLTMYYFILYQNQHIERTEMSAPAHPHPKHDNII